MNYLGADGLIISSCLLIRDLYLLPVFGWMVPFFTDLSIIEKVTGRSFSASSLSLFSIAALIFLICVRKIDLFLLLTAFR